MLGYVNETTTVRPLLTTVGILILPGISMAVILITFDPVPTP